MRRAAARRCGREAHPHLSGRRAARRRDADGGHGVMVARRRVLAVEVLSEGAVGVPERDDGLCLLGGLLARMGALKAGHRGTAESSELSLRRGRAVLSPRALGL